MLKVAQPIFPFRAPFISLRSFQHHNTLDQRAPRGPAPVHGFLDSIFRQAKKNTTSTVTATSLLSSPFLSNELIFSIFTCNRSTDTAAVDIEPDALGQALLDAIFSEHQTLSSSSPSAPPSLVAPGIQCSDIAGQGRGLIATQPLKQGQTVLSIPLEAAITPEKAAQMSSLHDLISRYTAFSAGGGGAGGGGDSNSTSTGFKQAPLPDWTILALWLAELVHQNSSTSPSNFSGRAMHAAYSSVLPETTNCILEWTEEEVSWLRGSYLYTLAVDIRTAAETSWKELEAIVHHAERAGLIAHGVLTEISLQHAFALLLSRLIHIYYNNGTEIEVLCPWADFINHDSRCSSFLQLDQEKNENIVLVADRNYRPGEQIFASYGQKTSGEMLLSYGFMPEEGSNPHDACLISIEIEDYEESATGKGGRGKKQGENKSKKVFPLRMGAVPEGLLEALCSSVATSSSLGEQLLVDICKRKLETYSISLEDAKAELSNLAGARETSDGSKDGNGITGGGLGKKKVTKTIYNERREAVLKLLVREQKILARTIFLMKQQLKQISPRK